MSKRLPRILPAVSPPEAPERCGSWRVTEYVEGYEYRIEWCARRGGPCPYPGTHLAATRRGDQANRPCRAALEEAVP